MKLALVVAGGGLVLLGRLGLAACSVRGLCVGGSVASRLGRVSRGIRRGPGLPLLVRCGLAATTAAAAAAAVPGNSVQPPDSVGVAVGVVAIWMHGL